MSTNFIIGEKEGVRGEKEIKALLENGSTQEKIRAMKDVIRLHANGESQQNLVMTYIRFVLPDRDHYLKKLGYYYLSQVEKVDGHHKLLPEMILICNFIRNDLSHPNEYVRGFVLRFVSGVKEEELIEPLTDSILLNLEHRHSYVRRNAVMAIFSVYSRHPRLMPDAPERILEFLGKETDVAARKNGFLMLVNTCQEKALTFLKMLDEVDLTTAGEPLQLAVVDLLKNMCKAHPQERLVYLSTVFSLLNSKSSAVLFQCASTLLSLSSSPVALKESAATFAKLLTMTSDNNVRLIVLERLVDLQERHTDVLKDLLLDLLRSLSIKSIDIRKKILNLALNAVVPATSERMVTTLIDKLNQSDRESDQEYQQCLIRTIHKCCGRIPSVNTVCVAPLLQYINAPGMTGVEVGLFARDVILTQPSLRESILTTLKEKLSCIKTDRVTRTVMWLLGTYFKREEGAIREIMGALEEVLGSILTDEEPDEDLQPGVEINLRKGNFFSSTSLSTTLTKLTLEAHKISPELGADVEGRSLAMMGAILKLGKTTKPTIDEDSHERILLCQRQIRQRTVPVISQILEESMGAFNEMGTSIEEEKKEEDPATLSMPVGSPIVYTQLIKGRVGVTDPGVVEDLEMAVANEAGSDTFVSRLRRVVQLTGFSDDVYCEGTMHVHQFDITLELLCVNQTSEPMTNLAVELATVGDLKLCERPQPRSLEAGEKCTITGSIKVSSSETGIIFGNISYDTPAGETLSVILSDVHIDILDYIKPAPCLPADFRSMWAEFEWENKVAVATEIQDLKEYLAHIMKHTNMRCLDDQPLDDGCNFLSANLYSKSTFGEDALLNLSVEKTGEKIEGFIRIRCKMQGMALGLGDKITLNQ